MKVCGVCNRTYPDSASVCGHDGQRLQQVRRDDPTAAAPTLDWDGPMVGDIVGNFRVESLVAEGGMGRVYKATHIGLDRPVALKFLLPEHVVRADLVRRFFNEARALSAIRHPHIIDIFDFVEDVDAEGRAQVYMVMEYLEGEDARRRLVRCGPYHPELLVDIASQVAETLAAAHDAGFLHRDLKPDNVFLCQVAGRHDFVKLLDFGAAKAFGARPGHHLTRPGVAIGTPEYMSPEQIGNKPMDGRVDAYGLGCVCYELLTGTLPFRAPNVAQILAMHTQTPPDPMAERRRVLPPVPADLEAVVLRCMAKDPEDRYPDLWAVSEALRACRAAALDATNRRVPLDVEPLDAQPESADAPRRVSAALDDEWGADPPPADPPPAPTGRLASTDGDADWDPPPIRPRSSGSRTFWIAATLALLLAALATVALLCT